MKQDLARSFRTLLLTGAALAAPAGCWIDYLDPLALDDAGAPTDASADADAGAPCEAGATVITSCGQKCGTMLWTCNGAGFFTPDEQTECTGEGACTPGESVQCGASLEGIEYCDNTCSWSACLQ